MEKGQLIGTIIGISNVIPGILLSVFYKPIGTGMSSLGKKMHMDKLVGMNLYEERNSRRFILVVGIWLTVWGMIAFFLLPALIGGNP